MKSSLACLLAALPLLLAGCGEPAAPEENTVQAPTTRAAASPDADFVRAVTLSDGEAPAALHFRLVQRPDAGTEVEVALSLRLAKALTAGRISFAGRSGLSLATDATEFVFGAVESGQELPYTVVVRPAAEGIGELVAVLEGEAESGPFRAEYAVPVITAKAP